MNFIAKTMFAVLATVTALVASAYDASNPRSHIGNPALDSSLLSADCRKYVDDVGERAVTDFGLGILEGAGGLFGYGAEDGSEEPPPNPLYPAPMEKGALYFGGTDWGRFIPETLVLNDGVRPDVAVITQNALADGNYMAVIRERYGKRYAISSEGELTDAFREFVEGVQSGRIDARDAVEIEDGRVTVTGALAVMKINEILAKKLFEKNKGQHAMYVEESYPIEWVYDYMTPHGLVMKLNAEKPGAVSDEEVRDNAEFWDWMTKRLLSDPQFAKRRAERWRRTADGEWDPDHRMGVRAFAKLRLTHAKFYARQAKNPIAFARAIRQAIAIDPQDKETCINYAAFLKVNKLDTVRDDFLDHHGDVLGLSKDHFADELSIPTELEQNIVMPGDQVGSPFDSDEVYDDDFARAVFAALSKEGGDNPTVTCDLSALSELVHNRRDELMAYLARHPGWWLHEDHGRLCATRRWRNKGVWNHPLHGYYSGNAIQHDRVQNSDASQATPHYQTRTTIGFPFSPFGRDGSANHKPVSIARADVSKGSLQSFQSSERFGDKDFCVEVFEESSARERRITNAVLVFLKDEFLSLTNLPPDAVVRGSDEFTLRNGMQPGIYNLTLRINPGEPGLVYLKAFEATKGSRLSKGRLKEASNERIGWSNDPEEKFLYENEFTIYEGDWGKPYAARIEVWFRPDSGQPERKLMERVCKIEGWMR